jgi:TRAP-type C4-dicarboxylate transport system substrate-binding protein
MFKWLFTFAIFISLNFPSVYSQDTQIIRLGTLAMEGSDWGLILQKMNTELIQKSRGRLKFQFFFGRDDADLVELVKNQQLDAASLTIVGLGRILQSVYLLYLPMLFSNDEELDYLRDKLTPEYEAQFKEKGFTLLGWGDFGSVYLFSKEPIRTQTDLQKTRFWIWTIDPIGQAFAAASGNTPILLPVEGVLPSLSKGEVQTVFCSPLTCIVLQWYNYVNYMTDLPLVSGVGASIISKERFEQIPKSDRTLLLTTARKYHRQLVEKIRESNEESVEILRGQGIKIISVPQQEVLKWRQIAEQVQNQFADKFFDKKSLDKARKLLNEFRSSKK